jgi:hypothetical protein
MNSTMSELYADTATHVAAVQSVARPKHACGGDDVRSLRSIEVKAARSMLAHTHPPPRWSCGSRQGARRPRWRCAVRCRSERVGAGAGEVHGTRAPKWK